MVKQRPVVVTVMGILNIIFGGIWLLIYTCVGVLLLFLFIALSQAEVAREREVRELKELWTVINREVPGFNAFLIVSLVLSLLLPIIEIVAGIGLLRMRSWGRVLSIFYSAAVIASSIASLIYRFGVVNPGMERAMRDWVAQKGAQMGPDPVGSQFNNIFEVIGTFIGMSYAIILLIVMLLPTVSAAFRGETAIGGPYDRPDEDYYDEGYERRRRDDLER
jgi:hypothetical protein